ncbi:MAG: hypothetical protein R3E79_14875 [Caldilineaceae bacterium]
MNESKRYLIDDHNLAPDLSLTLYHITLAWVISRGNRFMLTLQPDLYDDPMQLERLYSLGQIVSLNINDRPNDWFSRILSKIFVEQRNMVAISGSPSTVFLQVMTQIDVPLKVGIGDLCPVEDLQIFLDERRLYFSSDYGRTQILILTEEELNSLHQVLQEAGFDITCVILAPSYLTDA